MSDAKLGKWKKPSADKVRRMARALGIPGADRRDVEELRKAINHELLRCFYRR